MGFYSLLEEVMCGFQYFIYSIIIFVTPTRTVSKIIQSKWNEPFLFSYESKEKRKKLTFLMDLQCSLQNFTYFLI